jgi:UDP-N-acetylglucosamine 2-epimerase (non-hydrolysing)
VQMLETLQQIGRDVMVVFPVHPRTRQRLAEAGVNRFAANHLRLLDPLPYLDFLALQTRATLVITDSGGVQEESTYLGIPCLTVRENTERPITVDMGTNILVGRDLGRVRSEFESIVSGHPKGGARPPLWDGKAAGRIAQIVCGKC